MAPLLRDNFLPLFEYIKKGLVYNFSLAVIPRRLEKSFQKDFCSSPAPICYPIPDGRNVDPVQ